MSSWGDLAAPVGEALRELRAHVEAAFACPPAKAQFKDDGSAITALDLELEARLAERLLAIDATFGLHSEEAGLLRSGNPTWHLDPLDGTANFQRRLPLFGTQVVLLDGEQPCFGAIYEPLRDHLCWAGHGAGAWHDDRRLTMAPGAAESARLHVDLSREGIFMDDPTLLVRLRQGSYRLRALGSAALQLRDVALGVADAFVGGRATASPIHDIGPGLLMIREAGGVDSDGHGGNSLLDRRVVIAGSPAVHDWIVTMLSAPAS